MNNIALILQNRKLIKEFKAQYNKDMKKLSKALDDLKESEDEKALALKELLNKYE